MLHVREYKGTALIDLRYESMIDLIELNRKVYYLKHFSDTEINKIYLTIWYMPQLLVDYNYRDKGNYLYEEANKEIAWVCDFINALHIDMVYVFDINNPLIIGKLNNCEELAVGDVTTIINDYTLGYNVFAINHSIIERYQLSSHIEEEHYKRITYITNHMTKDDYHYLSVLREKCDTIHLVVTHLPKDMVDYACRYADYVYTTNSAINMSETNDKLYISKVCDADTTAKPIEKPEWQTNLEETMNESDETTKILSELVPKPSRSELLEEYAVAKDSMEKLEKALGIKHD